MLFTSHLNIAYGHHKIADSDDADAAKWARYYAGSVVKRLKEASAIYKRIGSEGRRLGRG
jgi:glutamine synthetase